MIKTIRSDSLDKENMDWLNHGFFTRHGGVSRDIYSSLNCGTSTEDNVIHVKTNRERIAEQMGVFREKLVFLNQVHSDKVVTVTKTWNDNKSPEADAMVTDRRGFALAIMTADCVPVLFADREKQIIGAAHAGWKGALGGVLEATVKAMQELGSNPEDIEAVIGPCIGPNSYEVSADFKANFLSKDAENESFFKESLRDGHFNFNLPGYVSFRLEKSGINAIYDVKQDTLVNESVFFSNRRSFLKSEKGYGLQASVILMR